MASIVDFLQSLGGDSSSPNSYVKDNWPSDGRHLMHTTHPETFYTPAGATPPPGGRGPTIGEDIEGAPAIHQLIPFLSLLLSRYQGGQ